LIFEASQSSESGARRFKVRLCFERHKIILHGMIRSSFGLAELAQLVRGFRPARIAYDGDLQMNTRLGKSIALPSERG
jgi:hypothetical protein